MPRCFEARIRFLTTQEGGLLRSPRTGIRPHIKVGDVFTSCVVHANGMEKEFELGKEYDVTVEVVFWDQYRDEFHDLKSVELYNGNKLVARGRFVRDPVIKE